jgi:hypothetical protein
MRLRDLVICHVQAIEQRANSILHLMFLIADIDTISAIAFLQVLTLLLERVKFSQLRCA